MKIPQRLTHLFLQKNLKTSLLLLTLSHCISWSAAVSYTAADSSAVRLVIEITYRMDFFSSLIYSRQRSSICMQYVKDPEYINK